MAGSLSQGRLTRFSQRACDYSLVRNAGQVVRSDRQSTAMGALRRLRNSCAWVRVPPALRLMLMVTYRECCRLGREGSCGFLQPLRLERRLYGGACSDALHEAADVRPFGKVDANELRPVGQCEEIGIGDAEIRAGEISAPVRQTLLQQIEASADLLAKHWFIIIRRGRSEQGREGLVDFGRQEEQQLLHLEPLPRTGRRYKLCFRRTIGEVFLDHHAFREVVAVIELKHRYIAFRIDG